MTKAIALFVLVFSSWTCGHSIEYPLVFPHAYILYPQSGMEFGVSKNHMPVIKCQGYYNPGLDTLNEPAIKWYPSQIINTADYYHQIIAAGGELKVPISFTVENQMGKASDTIIIQLVLKDLHYFAVHSVQRVIEYGGSTELMAIAAAINGKEIIGENEFPDETPVKITATPKGYGHFQKGGTYFGDTIRITPCGNSKKEDTISVDHSLSESFNITYGAARSPYGLVFIADGVIPNKDQIIVITVQKISDTTKTGTSTLVIKPPSYPVISLSKYYINQGDTIEVRIKKKTRDSICTVTDYPVGTKFYFTILKGEEYGAFLDSQMDETLEIYSTECARFVASENIDVDSAIVTFYGEVPTNLLVPLVCEEPTARVVIARH